MNYVMRTCFVLLTLLIAAAVPNFGVIFSLFASICVPFSCVFVPILFGARIRSKIGAETPGPCRWAYHSFIMAFAAFCMVIGFYDSVCGLLDEIRR